MKFVIIILLLYLTACSDSSSVPESSKKAEVIIPTTVKEGAANISWTAPLSYTDQTILERLGGYKLYISKDRNEIASKTISPIVLGPETVNIRVEELELDVYYFGITAVDIDNIEGEMSEIIERQITKGQLTQFLSCNMTYEYGATVMNCI